MIRERPGRNALLKAFVFAMSFLVVKQACSWGQDAEHQLRNGDETRTYHVHLPPSYDRSKQVPLIIVLHGGGGNHRHAEQVSGMSQKADEQDMMVAYPDGSGRLESVLTWNATHCCGYAVESGAKDVVFIDRMIDKIAADYSIDDTRIYVAGMSNGAMLAFQVSIALSHKIAAVGAVVGAMFGDEARPAEAVPVIMFNGVDDRHVPIEGGYSAVARVEQHMGRPFQSVTDTFDFWRAANGCGEAPQVQRSGNVERIGAQGCAGGSEVILYKLYGAGHAWPGGQRGSRWGDEPMRDVSATDLMVEFFMRHTKAFTDERAQ